jgi:acetolactate synthase regulatory subunit
MSGIKSGHLTEFYRKLRARGMTVSKLARKMMAGRTHLTLVINGDRPGSQTWRKLERVLKTEELALLQAAKREREHAAVSRETLLHVETLPPQP